MHAFSLLTLIRFHRLVLFMYSITNNRGTANAPQAKERFQAVGGKQDDEEEEGGEEEEEEGSNTYNYVTYDLYEILTVFCTLVMLAAVATYAVEKPLQQWLTNALTVPVSKKHDDLRDEEELQVSEHAKCCCCTVKPTGTSNEFDEESSDFVHTGSCGQATGCFCCCGRSDPSHGKMLWRMRLLLRCRRLRGRARHMLL